MNRKIILAALLAGMGTGLSACVAVPYETSPQYRGADRDRDRDGVPNRVDRHRDGDGVPTHPDSRPNDPRRY
jgi:hypothetical protein